jgi:hypothetical protein
MKPRKTLLLILISITSALLLEVTAAHAENPASSSWSLSALPSSVRLNPVTDKILDRKPAVYPSQRGAPQNLLGKNWVYDGNKVSLHGARGEYVSFQLVLTRHTGSTLKHISVHMKPFANGSAKFHVKPELFLEWSVDVETTSTGYQRATLGKGWYPDALIPFKFIQQDPSKVKRRWVYPLWLPDFNNRIPQQKSLIVWVDQYIPFKAADAKPGTYSSSISMTIGNKTKKIPVRLHVWNFAIPNQLLLKASLQQGFLSGKNDKLALEIYQLFKRNRIGLQDPTYRPKLSVSKAGKVSIDWSSFDKQLKKYFTGKAFTKKYGYDYGPGYGEPIETFILPFDVYGKYGTKGWPDIGKPDVERKPKNRSIYIRTIEKVRDHLRSMVNPKKTDLIVYLNGLDESYFPEAWHRMAYYGDLFHKYYPEAHFRIDGAYGKKAIEIVHNAIDYWSVHTLDYDIDQIRKYRKKWGIKDWVYGPLIYEGKVNSWVGSYTFTDLPLLDNRALSWACWKYGTYSWLSWGIGANWKKAWYDPITWENAYKDGADSDSRYTYKKLNGNALLVYSPGIIPNVTGPSPSIRLKATRDGIQEYAYLRLLSKLDGNKKRADEIVNTLINRPFGKNSIGHLNVWNYDAEKWDKIRIRLGKMISQAIQENRE